MEKRTALLTGATGGIGLAIARKLASCGFDLILVGRRLAKLNQIRALCLALGSTNVDVFEVDLAVTEQLSVFLDQFIDTYHRLDLLVHAAGVWNEKNVVDSSLDEWDSSFNINVRSAFLLFQRSVTVLERGNNPTIVALSSISGKRTYAGGTMYCASKYALEGFCGSLFYDIRNLGIKVTTISPGLVNTELHAGDRRLDPDLMIQPDDIADIVLFVADFPQNSCITEITVQPQRVPRVDK